MFGWLSKHATTIAVLAASTVAFVAVTALTGGVGAAPQVALLAGGVASGATGYATGQLLRHEPISLASLAIQGVLAGVVTVATCGLGRVLVPALSDVLAPTAARLVANSTAGATLGGATVVLENALARKPLLQGVGQGALLSAATGVLLEPALRGVAALHPATGPAEPLTHLTSDKGYGLIQASGEVRGKQGVFAIPSRFADESTAMKVARTGLEPHSTTNKIAIPEAANPLFVKAQPIGPYSALKWWGGVYYAPPGAVNITTGALTASGAAVGGDALIYGPDLLLLYTAAMGAHIAASKDDAPPPSSPGLVATLGKAAKD